MDDSFKEISTIIHRDRKFNTYKFALIRATIESINQYDHYVSIYPYYVKLPLGIQILKWLEYYYSIFSSNTFIAQQYGDKPERSLAFRNLYNEVITFYFNHFGEGFEPIFNSLKEGKVAQEIKPTFIALIKKLKDTIVKNPMYYIGSSIDQGGEIYRYNKDSNFRILYDSLSINTIIKSAGTYTIPKHYYEVFKIMGSYILGMDSLIYKWADFTLDLNKEKIQREKAISLVFKPLTQTRNVNEVKAFYIQMQKEKQLYCVWSGRKIKSDLNIDHLLPFSFYQNNDVWNLLPTTASINNKKRDSIPSSNLLNNRRRQIYDYWSLTENKFGMRFHSEIEFALLGSNKLVDDWKDMAFQNLQNKCEFLINDQGFEPFELRNDKA
jgi:hypothetical protein